MQASEKPELQKPDGQRLREYTEANLPALKQALFNPAPIHQDLEIEKLTFTLGKLREELGADDSYVRRLFKERSPAELARALVESSALANVEERKRLFDGGREAIKVSTDPMIVATRDTMDPYARSVREDYETNVEAPFASTDPTTRTRDASFQEPGLSPKISLNLRSRLQHFQRPAPSHFGKHAPGLSRISL